MQRIPPNSRVRRRLFAEDDVTDQAKVDNLANFLQESELREMEEKSKKWNYDFVNDLPLEGDWEWYKRDATNDWIGIKPKTFRANEATPKSGIVGSLPLVRKRKRDTDGATRDEVKRKINFE